MYVFSYKVIYTMLKKGCFENNTKAAVIIPKLKTPFSGFEQKSLWSLILSDSAFIVWFFTRTMAN